MSTPSPVSIPRRDPNAPKYPFVVVRFHRGDKRFDKIRVVTKAMQSKNVLDSSISRFQDDALATTSDKELNDLIRSLVQVAGSQFRD